MAVLTGLLVILGHILFVLVLLAGAVLTLLGIPGTLVIFADALLFSALNDWKLPWWFLLVLLGISVFAEVADNVIGAAGVKKYGGSSKGMMWAFVAGMIGAFAGAAVLSPVLGLVGAVVGPLVGGVLGGFAGGYWYERRAGRSVEEAKRAGVGAMLGRVAGTLLKVILAAVMVVLVLTMAYHH